MNKLFLYLSLNGVDVPVGTLSSSTFKGRETFSFQFDSNYLVRTDCPMIDPRLFLFQGLQYDFGFLNDMTPDRFGTMLIDKIEQTEAVKENRVPRKLTLRDYLVRVNDASRMGALRIKEDVNGPFLNNNKEAIPPYIFLKDIEYASMMLEEGDDPGEDIYRRLLAPGSSLGGARPKASVYYNDEVFLAKFPSRKDDYDVELWEFICNSIAGKVGLSVPESKLEHYSTYGHTLLLKRFDRASGQRIHYLSGVTAVSANDGDSGSFTYLDLANFIISNCVKPQENLFELYRRMVFIYLVNDTDNHLRNHAFLFTGGGYQLSPMFDVNPTFYHSDFELPFGFGNSEEGLVNIAKYFYVEPDEARTIIASFKSAIQSGVSYYAKKYPSIAEQTKVLLQLIAKK